MVVGETDVPAGRVLQLTSDPSAPEGAGRLSAGAGAVGGPVRVDCLPDGAAGDEGVRYPRDRLTDQSAFRYFNQNQINCNLLRQPDCSSLRDCDGPVSKYPPALVKVIERYLAIRS